MSSTSVHVNSVTSSIQQNKHIIIIIMDFLPMHLWCVASNMLNI